MYQDAGQALERLHRAALIVAGSHNIDQALQSIVDSAREAIGAEFAALGIPGESGQPMRRFLISGVDPLSAGQTGHPPVGRGILGTLLNGHNIRISNVDQHPKFTGYPGGHPLVRSFLGVPIRVDGIAIADLYLANKIGAPEFSESDESLTEMLAAHAAVVIRNLHFQEQDQEMALLRERETIARQLQDDVLQEVYGVGLMLRTLELTGDETRTAVAQIREHLDDVIERLRKHLLNLAGDENGRS